LGRPLVEALVDRGHEVTASTHRTENFSVIEALGARPALMDGLDDAAVRQAILETTDRHASRVLRHPAPRGQQRQGQV
jgi:2-alkyl-3-oxoalkanoate reductase